MMRRLKIKIDGREFLVSPRVYNAFTTAGWTMEYALRLPEEEWMALHGFGRLSLLEALELKAAVYGREVAPLWLAFSQLNGKKAAILRAEIRCLNEIEGGTRIFHGPTGELVTDVANTFEEIQEVVCRTS